MHARLLGFFSGFPMRHFPQDIAAYLRQALAHRQSLVFVSAWPLDHTRNIQDMEGMYSMFLEQGIAFSHHCVIDSTIMPADAAALVRAASCIFLMGGNATEQFALMARLGITEIIRQSPADILGVSAGAANMGRQALDLWESIRPYAGLGLADLTVKAHFNERDERLMRLLRQASMELPICAMEDESAILVKGIDAVQMGRIHWMDEGVCTPFTQRHLQALVRSL